MILTVLLSLILFHSTLDYNGQTLLAPEFSPRNTKMTYCDGVYSVVTEPIDKKFFLLQKGNKTYKLFVPDSVLKNRSHVFDISVIGESLFLLDIEKQVFEFKYLKDEYTYVRNFEIPLFCIFMDVDDEHITCFNAFLAGDNRGSKSQTYNYRISRNSGEKNLQYFDNPIGLEYSLVMPRKLIDYKKGKTIVSDAIQYNIKIYDDNGNLVDSLIRQPENWKVAKRMELKENVKNSFGNIMSEYKKKSLIQKVNFVDDNRILVSWTSPNNDNLETFFDMWLQKDGSWAIAGKDMNNRDLSDDKLFDPRQEKVPANYVVSSDRILSLLSFPFQLDEKLHIKTKMQVDSVINDYLYENELRYSVFEWKIK